MGMFIALIYTFFGIGQVYAVNVAQIIVSAATCLVPYAMTQALAEDKRFGKIVSLLMVFDLSAIGVSIGIGAEVLSNFFVASTLLFLARLLKHNRRRDALACGAAVVLAALARPNAVYFVPIVAVIIFGLSSKRWINVTLFLLVCVVGLTPWFFRNYLYHRVFTFSTVANLNLLFYRGTSVEYWATGKPVEEIQAQLAYELDRRLNVVKPDEVYTASSIWRHMALDEDPAADRVMREMALEIFIAHPQAFIVSLSVALLKVLGYSEAFNILPFFRSLNIFWNLVVYSLGLLGSVILFRKKQWRWLALTVVPTAYFIAVPTIAGGIQDTRSATSVTICFALLAVYGMREIWRWRDRIEKQRFV
jgi:4-amino-4-deoxy-L-arabinose transferase-like glycosyltransferase